MVDAAALVLRITLGAVFVAHGTPKMFGPVAGPHGRGRTEGLLASRGLPYPKLLVWGLALAELSCGLLLVAGLFTRVAAVVLCVIIALAIPLAKWKHGFIDGWDYPFTLVGACAAMVLLGPGNISVDAALGLPL